MIPCPAFLNKYDVTYSKEIPDNSSWILSILLTYVLPIVILWVLLSFLFRKMSGGGMMGGVGKSNAKVYVQKETGVTFKDVAGEDEAKESLQEVVDFLHNPGKYTKIGAKLPKGALLVGPPEPVKHCWLRQLREKHMYRSSHWQAPILSSCMSVSVLPVSETYLRKRQRMRHALFLSMK